METPNTYRKASVLPLVSEYCRMDEDSQVPAPTPLGRRPQRPPKTRPRVGAACVRCQKRKIRVSKLSPIFSQTCLPPDRRDLSPAETFVIEHDGTELITSMGQSAMLWYQPVAHARKRVSSASAQVHLVKSHAGKAVHRGFCILLQYADPHCHEQLCQRSGNPGKMA